MKVFKSLIATVLLTATVSAGAFAQRKIVAIVKTANWCSVCKANGERAIAALHENNKDGTYQFVMNDISSPETAKKSAPEIEKLGLTQAMKPYMATGVVYLFDARTKKPINQLIMALSNEDIARAMAYLKQGK